MSDIVTMFADDFSKSTMLEIKQACEHRSMLLWKAYGDETDQAKRFDYHEAWQKFDRLAESIRDLLAMQSK